jgi:hypothetical protein
MQTHLMTQSSSTHPQSADCWMLGPHRQRQQHQAASGDLMVVQWQTGNSSSNREMLQRLLLLRLPTCKTLILQAKTAA